MDPLGSRPMTDAERAEAGFKAYLATQRPDATHFPSLAQIEAILRAGYPELHGDPPTVGALEIAARAICEADPLSPAPDAPILIGTKRAKAWEPRAAILRQAIEAGLFAWPPKSWLAPTEPDTRLIAPILNTDYREIWEALRTAHLRTGEGKE